MALARISHPRVTGRRGGGLARYDGVGAAARVLAPAGWAGALIVS
jgi:hypothetical protein